MTEISYIRVKTKDIEYVGIPYELIETYDERIESTPMYIHRLTNIKNLKDDLVAEYKKLNDIKHPDK